MKLERTKNTIRNITIGGIHRIITQIGPFLLRTLVIYKLGTEYAGMGSLFSSILQVLNLAELGIGTTIVYNMYLPVANDDTAKICALLDYYKRIYHIIGGIIGAVGLLLTPFIPNLVTGNVPADVNLQTVYIVYLSSTVSSYFFGAYKKAILFAYQRNDIENAVGTMVYIGIYLMRATVLLISRKFYVYIFLNTVGIIIQNEVTSRIVDQMFPHLKEKALLLRKDRIQLYKKTGALLAQKVGATLSNGIDNVIISTYLGLKIVGISGNYLLIINAVITITGLIYSSMVAGVGNMLNTESDDRVLSVFNRLTFLNLWIQVVCGSCLLCLFQPFIACWAGTDNMFTMDTVFVLTIYFYTFIYRNVITTFRDASGLWEKDWPKSLISGGVNLCLSIATVKQIGINGVFVSTIASLWLIEIPWETFALFKYSKHLQLFSKAKYIRQQAFRIPFSVLIIVVSYFLTRSLPFEGLIGFLLKGVFCVFYSNLVLCIAYKRNENFAYFENVLRKIFRKAYSKIRMTL